MDIHPPPFVRGVVANQPREAVENGNGCVAPVQTIAYCGAGSSVHTSCRGTNVHDCNAQVPFFGERDVEGGFGDGGALIGLEVFLEFGVAKFHCAAKVLFLDCFSDFVGLKSSDAIRIKRDGPGEIPT